MESKKAMGDVIIGRHALDGNVAGVDAGHAWLGRGGMRRVKNAEGKNKTKRLEKKK